MDFLTTTVLADFLEDFDPQQRYGYRYRLVQCSVLTEAGTVAEADSLGEEDCLEVFGVARGPGGHINSLTSVLTALRIRSDPVPESGP